MAKLPSWLQQKVQKLAFIDQHGHIDSTPAHFVHRCLLAHQNQLTTIPSSTLPTLLEWNELNGHTVKIDGNVQAISTQQWWEIEQYVTLHQFQIQWPNRLQQKGITPFANKAIQKHNFLNDTIILNGQILFCLFATLTPLLMANFSVESGTLALLFGGLPAVHTVAYTATKAQFHALEKFLPPAETTWPEFISHMTPAAHLFRYAFLKQFAYTHLLHQQYCTPRQACAIILITHFAPNKAPQCLADTH